MVENTIPFEKDFKDYRAYLKNIDINKELTIDDIYKWLYVRYFGIHDDIFTNKILSNDRKNFLKSVKETLIHQNVAITNKDAGNFIKTLIHDKLGTASRRKEFYFIDPPYIDTKTNCYDTNNITLEYITSVLDIIIERNEYSKIMFTYKKDSKFIEILEEKGFTIHQLNTCKDIKSVGNEICAINYEPGKKQIKIVLRRIIKMRFRYFQEKNKRKEV